MALQELLSLGARATPVAVFGEGADQQVVMGFDRDKIEALLES